MENAAFDLWDTSAYDHAAKWCPIVSGVFSMIGAVLGLWGGLPNQGIAVATACVVALLATIRGVQAAAQAGQRREERNQFWQDGDADNAEHRADGYGYSR